MSLHRARAVWTGKAWLDDATVELDGSRVVACRPARAGDPASLDGLILPGLVNAHTHLEFSWAEGQVPAGLGFGGWARQLTSLVPPGDARERAAAAARGLFSMGHAAVCDITNAGDTAALIADAGLVGIAQHELLGMDLSLVPERLVLAARPIAEVRTPSGSVWARPSPHSGYSTPPELLVAAGRPGPVPASIHVAESSDELAFLARGEGPIAAFLDRVGRDWSWFEARGDSPIAYLDRLGLIGPDVLLVHGVHLTEADRRRIVQANASLCLSPRSNRHIGGQLPDAPSLVEAGVRLAIGTDSLGSAPDLDVLGEVALLVESFPGIDPVHWLRAVTSGGADALRLPVGRLAPGTCPGVLFLEGVRSATDLRAPPSRRWLATPGSHP